MKTEKRFLRESHNRMQVSRTRRYIRTRAADGISLAAIAQQAGTSPFHFCRLFAAVTGETVFGYVTRVRLRHATALLAQDARDPITEIALSVGYQTPSAFNRVFRAALGVSPTRFRTASPTLRRRLLERLEGPRRRRAMKLDLATQPEIRQRVERAYLHVSRVGVCAEEAPGAWLTLQEILAAPATMAMMGPRTEFVGSSFDDPTLERDDEMRYQAGITAEPGVKPPPGLTLGTVSGGRYAVFRYRGPYRHIWQAVDQIFRGWVVKSGATLRYAPLLELYLNDPRETPEADLITELCVPIE